MRLTTQAIQKMQEAGIVNAARLAEETGISRVTAGNALDGKRIGANTASAIAKILNAEPAAIIHFEEKDGILAEQAAIATQLAEILAAVRELDARLLRIREETETEVRR